MPGSSSSSIVSTIIGKQVENHFFEMKGEGDSGLTEEEDDDMMTRKS